MGEELRKTVALAVSGKAALAEGLLQAGLCLLEKHRRMRVEFCSGRDPEEMTCRELSTGTVAV